MAALTVINFVTLDGVIQSPLSPDEDDFAAGGWVQPHMDEVVAETMGDATTAAGALLLGRRTYEIFAASWSTADRTEPAVAALNAMPKYVASTTLTTTTWENSHLLAPDPIPGIVELKSRPGGDIVIFGSGTLIPALMAADLIDRWTLLTFPVVLGAGKRMFPTGAPSTTLTLLDSRISPKGVAILTYGRP